MKKEIETEIDGRVYETALLIVDSMSEGEALEKYNSVKQSIAELGASFISEELPYLRELSYEMIRVIKNQNVRFDQAYFAWVKYEADPAKVPTLKKKLDLDEDIIRFMTVKTVAENTTYTKPNPVVRAESLINNEDGEVESELVAGVVDEIKDDALANPLD
mgnify:CR=1 FL=1